MGPLASARTAVRGALHDDDRVGVCSGRCWGCAVFDVHVLDVVPTDGVHPVCHGGEWFKLPGFFLFLVFVSYFVPLFSPRAVDGLRGDAVSGMDGRGNAGLSNGEAPVNDVRFPNR